jgi:hypothetical protein
MMALVTARSDCGVRPDAEFDIAFAELEIRHGIQLFVPTRAQIVVILNPDESDNMARLVAPSGK